MFWKGLSVLHRLIGVLDVLGDVAVQPELVVVQPAPPARRLTDGLEDPGATRIAVAYATLGLAVALGVVALLAALGVSMRREVALIDPEAPESLLGGRACRMILLRRRRLLEPDSDVGALPLAPGRGLDLGESWLAPAICEGPSRQRSRGGRAVLGHEAVRVAGALVADEDRIEPPGAHVAVGVVARSLARQRVEHALTEAE